MKTRLKTPSSVDSESSQIARSESLSHAFEVARLLDKTDDSPIEPRARAATFRTGKKTRREISRRLNLAFGLKKRSS